MTYPSPNGGKPNGGKKGGCPFMLLALPLIVVVLLCRAGLRKMGVLK